MNKHCPFPHDALTLPARPPAGYPVGTGPAAGNPAVFPEFGEHALRDFETSSSPMRIFDLETLKYVAVNDAAVRFYGYSREEFLSMTVRDTRHPEDHRTLDVALTVHSDYLRHQPAHRHVTKSGEVEVEVVTQDIMFRGCHSRLTLTIDIAERDRLLLHQREQEFRALVENSRDIISRLDRGFRHVYVNSAIVPATGRQPGDFVGKTIAEVGMPAELVARWSGALDEVFATGREQTVESTHNGPRGVRFYESRIFPEFDAGGGVETALVVTRDFTDRKRAEQELRQTQQHLQIAVRGGGVGLWDWDVKAGTVYFSPEWKQQLGYEDHELSSSFEEWDSRLHPEDHDRLAGQVREFLARPQSDYRAEYRLRHRDGSYRWILSRAAAQIGDNGSVERMFGCHVDVTEQKQAETERLEIAVRQRDALVREVHHRIKNSLQGVAGLLRQKVKKHPELAPAMDEALAQLQSVALVYGLRGTRADGVLSLAAILEAVCFSTESLTGGRVDMAFERGSPRPACVAGSEAVSLAVALNELVFNAMKHQRAETEGRHARVMLRETENAAEIRITNHGNLPAGFDFPSGRAAGNGLELVRILLAPPGGGIAFNGGSGVVEVVLKLRPPLLAECQHARSE